MRRRNDASLWRTYRENVTFCQLGRAPHELAAASRPGTRAVGEPACKPDSVTAVKPTTAGGHPSRAAVADGLVRPTRKLGRAALPQLALDASCLALLRAGFAEPPGSPRALVVSYTTVSPLPPIARRRSLFCGTFPRVAPGGCCPPPCPVESGLSSAERSEEAPTRPPGRLAHREAKGTAHVRCRPVPVVVALVGVLAIATGWLPLDAARDVLERSAPVLGFLVAITVLAELADDAGLFEAAASVTSRLGGGSVRRLFILVCALCTVTTVVLSLDTTAVLLTPVVLAMCQRLGLPLLPFAFATVWLANCASLLLPVSNLTNLLAAHKTGVHALEYAAHAALPQAGLLVATLTVLLLRHRTALRGRYQPAPAPVARDPLLLRLAAGVTALTAALLIAGLSPWAVATAGAAVLVGAFVVRRPYVLRPRLLPWPLVAMTLGLF